MLKAYANVGMPPSPITAAIFGVAAILEIVHPDSEVGESYGEFFKVNSAYVAGLGAVEASGLLKSSILGELVKNMIQLHW